MNICLIFRHPRPSFFSIEKVFNQLIPSLKENCTLKEVYLPHRQIKPGNIWQNIKFVKQQKADVFHVTGDVHYLTMALPKRKTVLTIHDCVFVENTTGIKRKILKFFFLDWPVRHAAYITTISEKSKADIIKYTGCPAKKIQVIPNSINNNIYYKPKHFNGAKPVLLFIGTKPNKNLDRVLDALKNIPCLLHIIGNVSPETQVLIEKSGVDYTTESNISEQELAQAYSATDVVLFPSVYEGFGLPIIEGNKAGRVVVTSNLSPMTDIAADAACLVNPFDSTSIKNGILKVISDADYRTELINNGFENVKRYEVDTIAEQYFKLYKSVVENSRTN